MLGPTEDEIQQAQERADKNGTTLYEEVEADGYTPGEIRDAFQDEHGADPELDAFLNERDSSCTNAELGLDEEGHKDDS